VTRDGSDDAGDGESEPTTPADTVGGTPIDEPPTASAESTQPESHVLDENLRTFPWLRAVGVAAATLAVEYALVAAIFVLGPSNVDMPSLSDRLIQYGFVLYNAHHVPTLVTASDAEVYGAAARNVLYGVENPSVPPLVFFLLPLVALVVAGALFELLRGASRSDSLLEEVALVGTGLGLGYVLVGFAGSFVFVRRVTFDSGAEGQAAPAVLWLLILLFFIPFVFAGLGTAARYLYDERLAQA